MYLCHVFCYGHELWHRAKGDTLKVHVKPCYDYALTIVGQFVTHFY